MKAKPINAKPINAGPLNRLLTILALRVRTNRWVERLCGRSPGLPTIFDVCIKVNPFGNLAEAHAMQFVAEHTSIPVPKVPCAFVWKGRADIAMSRIDGQMAASGWKLRSEESRVMILAQLRQMILELRSVPPPPNTGVGNVVGGPFWDCRLSSDLSGGPYATIRDFHEALVNNVMQVEDYTGLPAGVPELFDFYKQSKHELVLTHGDLSSLNILVKGDKVVGIIDWETAGWFPSYWEYTCAKNVNFYNMFWADEVDRFLTPKPYELKMEEIRNRYFGAY
ncbi:kinase-like domain-containing protein [Xylariaceae sp. FL0594]|nr:kinase-like domain-containing protein [Xylariaceae sp. FL0594]